MKILIAIAVFVFCSASPVQYQGGAKADDQGKIPDEINAIIQKSCKPCHFSGGGLIPTFHVNFSKWDNYGPEKKAKKARQMCSILLDGKMPPEEVREKRPEKIPSKQQVEAICKWAESLKAGMEK